MRDKKLDLMADPYIANYIDDLLRSLHLKSLLDICKPYKSVKLTFLARKLNVPEATIRSLLSELIIEDKIEGQIDQINGTLEQSSTERNAALKQKAMQEWSAKVLQMHDTLIKKVTPKLKFDQDDDFGFGGGDFMMGGGSYPGSMGMGGMHRMFGH